MKPKVLLAAALTGNHGTGPSPGMIAAFGGVDRKVVAVPHAQSRRKRQRMEENECRFYRVRV